MGKFLDNGQSVEYLYEGHWHKGIIHGVKTHETSAGFITRIAYLVDTGKVIREDVTKVSEDGKVLETVTQPEQIEIEEKHIKLA